MIKKWLYGFAGLLMLALFIHLSIEPLYTPTAIPTSAQHALFPKFIAHKSIVSGQFKGNTFEAIKDALGSYVDGIEVDIRISSDGVPFVYHGGKFQER